MVEEQFRRRLAGEVDRVEYTFRGRRKDGAIIELQCHGSVMQSSGRPVLFSVLMDITERSRAEREVLALQEQLREQSIHDPLTGLFNRRHLEGTLERALAGAVRREEPLSIVMADLDHFKSINDRLGHPAGDEVLRSFAALMRGQFRSCDTCCRYGGEEFVVVLPNCSHDTAIDRAEGLRRSTGEHVSFYAGEMIRATASFGVATFPEHGQTPAELIEAADAALYAAKSAGRNRVGVAHRR
jgi:diguanylate cyclase (GGDEF)-like protein